MPQPKEMSQRHVSFRIEERLLAQAKEKIHAPEGLGAFIRDELRAYTSGKRSYEPEKFGVISSPQKAGRLSLRIEDNLYEASLAKAQPFGGVSELIRVILKRNLQGRES